MGLLRLQGRIPFVGALGIFLAGCFNAMGVSDATGNMEVITATIGPDPDLDGYTVTVDGAQSTSITSNGTVTFAGLPPGEYAVALADVASNCMADENSRTVVVLGGESIRVGFAITCSSLIHPTVLVGAGDIARCSLDSDEATAVLMESIEGIVFTAGDNAYSDGTSEEFRDCYEPSWGRHKGRTRPSPGNHDYNTTDAAGYYGYFGAAAGDPDKGYYSYQLGSWHVIALNSNIERSGSSPQIAWLESDLASSAADCTVAYWHHPRFSSGQHGNNGSMSDLWDVLYAAGVDLVINGHDHNYERFAPQTPAGVADPTNGIRQFVVGTGGTSLRSMASVEDNSEVRNDDTHGVLKLTLGDGAYDWEFMPIEGQTFTDSGSGVCH